MENWISICQITKTEFLGQNYTLNISLSTFLSAHIHAHTHTYNIQIHCWLYVVKIFLWNSFYFNFVNAIAGDKSPWVSWLLSTEQRFHLPVLCTLPTRMFVQKTTMANRDSLLPFIVKSRHAYSPLLKNAASLSSGYLSCNPPCLQMSLDALHFTTWELGLWKQAQKDASTLATTVPMSYKSFVWTRKHLLRQHL